MADWVVDASAVMAWLREESGFREVESALPASILASVNLTEVVSALINRGEEPGRAIACAVSTPALVVAFDEPLALRAGELRAATRHRGLSLGDRACLALAERERLPVLTADRAWEGLDIGVEIRLIR